jgi:hypothetical protein
MFRKRDELSTSLEDAIQRVLNYMDMTEPGSDEYNNYVNQLERLIEARDSQKRNTNQISRDTLVVVAGNIVGILLIVAYEQHHVWSSKAFNTIVRPKNINVN